MKFRISSEVTEAAAICAKETVIAYQLSRVSHRISQILVYYEFEQAVQILAKALAYCDFPEDATSTIYRGPSCGQNNGAGDGTGRHEARRERGLYRWSRPLI